jgi:lipopolysaccharide export LptBFGC system permease protein LptF
MIGRTLFRYILGEMLKTLAVALAWLMLVGLLAIFVRASFADVGKLLSLSDCLTMLPWLAPYLFSMALPVAMLAASCSTFGRLGAENELVAMRAAGISPWTTAAAPLILGALASLALVWLSVEGFSRAAAVLDRRETGAAVTTERLTRPGSTLTLDSEDGRLVFSFGKETPDHCRPVYVTRTGRGTQGLQLSAQDFTCLPDSYRDERGRLSRSVTFILRRVHVAADPYAPYTTGQFAEYSLPEIRLPAGMSRGLFGGKNTRAGFLDNLEHARELRAAQTAGVARYRAALAEARVRLMANSAGTGASAGAIEAVRQLSWIRRELAERAEDLSDTLIEASRKLAFAFAPLAFALLGIPLGARARKASKLVSLTLGVAAAALYYGAWVAFKVGSQYGLVPAALAPWLPTALALAVSWWLLRRMDWR